MRPILKQIVCFMEGHELTNREERNLQKYTHHLGYNINPVECVTYESRYVCDCGRYKTDWTHVNQPRKHANV